MTKDEILELLKAEGFKEGRVFHDFEPIADYPHVIVRQAALVTVTHGIIWNGDVELNYEGPKLRWIGEQAGENFYVLDPASIAASDDGSPESQIRHALWWTCISREDEDCFFDLPEKSEWADSTGIQDPAMLPGVNWASQVTYFDSANAVPPWLAVHPSRRSLRTSPVVRQRSGPHRLVWFAHGKAVFEHDLGMLFVRFGDLQFVMSEDQKWIGAKRRGGGPVALIAPSPVPNHCTVESAAHELGMRLGLPWRELRKSWDLVQLLRDELEVPYRRGEARDLHRAVRRVLKVLGLGMTQGEVPPRLWAYMEWGQCASVTVHPAHCAFQSAPIPVDSFFRYLAQGGRIEDYLARNPELKPEDVLGVLAHVAHSLRL